MLGVCLGGEEMGWDGTGRDIAGFWEDEAM